MADQVQTETPRMKALKTLSAQLPVANQQVAKGQAAARTMQLQQAVAAAPSSAPTTSTAQNLGATSAANAGQQQLQSAQAGMQQQGQVAQLGQNETAQANQATLSGLQAGAKEAQMDNVQRLAKISEGAKQELYDKNMQFQKDEMGRTMFNDRQLLDYARANAQSNEQFQNYAQTAQLAYDRNTQMLQVAYQKATQKWQQEYDKAKQANDHQTQRDLIYMKQQMDEEMAARENEAANKSAAWGAGGTIVGAAAGAALGGSSGAKAGASIGGGLGALGSKT